MSFFRALLLCVLVFGAYGRSHALVRNDNPNVLISIVGEESITVRQTGTRLPGFALRVTDRQGVPIAGIYVEFYTDKYVCVQEPSCGERPESLFGRFVNGVETQYVLTDATGIARTVAYDPGTVMGSYRIRASVSASNGQKNRDVLKGVPSSDGYVQITQSFSLLDGHISGNWYDPGRSGQGLQLEIVEQNNQALVIWFVFGPDGNQNWIYAQGTYDPAMTSMTLPATISTGAKFPPLFRPADLQSTSWGTITLSFTDCNNGTLTWSSTLPGYGAGSQLLKRLTSIRGTKCPL